MKTVALSLATAALLAVGATHALASTSHAQAQTKVTVVMRDPGCHWFAVGKTFKTTLAVKGPVSLTNYDEKTLKVAGATVRRDPVGKSITLGKGLYTITMVGQAPDDNHLKLTVS